MHTQFFETYAIQSWEQTIGLEEQKNLIDALENGRVLFFPRLNFQVLAEELALLRPELLSPKTKNISLNPGTNQLRGGHGSSEEIQGLHSLLNRFAEQARQLIYRMFPDYQHHLQTGRTSYRPAEVSNRKMSYRKDDRRLHIDAFPSSPNQGQRILRIFSNINPHNQPRIWRIGEPFPNVAKRFLPQVKRPWRGTAKLLKLLKITKTLRTEYDHLMLQIHDKMKADKAYQQEAPQIEIHFPSGSSWVVQTDQASHAAMSGQHMLEQTFYLPVTAMKNSQRSPLKILESLTGRQLT